MYRLTYRPIELLEWVVTDIPTYRPIDLLEWAVTDIPSDD